MRVFLAWGQSNIDRNAPQTLARRSGAPPFLNAPAHPYYSRSDNGNGAYDVTFLGETVEAIRVWRPDTRTVGPAAVGAPPFMNGFNNAALGLVHQFCVRTGTPALLIIIAESTRPIERFLPSSTVNITNVTQGNPCVITVDDIRMFCINSPPSYNSPHLRFPVRIEGIAGMTELNGNTFTFASRKPDWAVTKEARVAVPGTIELYNPPSVNNLRALDSTSFNAYTGGGVIHMHHLWDRIEKEVPLALSAVGLESVDFIIDIHGEANSGAVLSNLWSTTGGVCTHSGYFARRLELKRLFRNQTWCRTDTKFLSFELAREDINGREKSRNDVIDLLSDGDALHAIASSGCYETVDRTHFADRFGYGYNAGWAALSALLVGTGKGIDYPKALRDITRPDGSIGSRSQSISLDETTFDANDEPTNGGRGWMLGQLFVCRSSVIIVPRGMNTATDASLNFEVCVHSTTGVTPRRRDGKTRVMVPSVAITHVDNDGSGRCRYIAVSHGFATGETIMVKNVVGVPGANGSGACHVIGPDSFTISSHAYSGSYSSGGDAWNTQVQFTNTANGAVYTNEYIFQEKADYAKFVYVKPNKWSVVGDNQISGYASIALNADSVFRPYFSSGVCKENGVHYVSGNTIHLNATLTASRTMTLPAGSTGEYAPRRGLRVRIVRTGGGAHTYRIGGLKELATNTWCDVEYTGTTWLLVGYGML